MATISDWSRMIRQLVKRVINLEKDARRVEQDLATLRDDVFHPCQALAVAKDPPFWRRPSFSGR